MSLPIVIETIGPAHCKGSIARGFWTVQYLAQMLQAIGEQYYGVRRESEYRTGTVGERAFVSGCLMKVGPFLGLYWPVSP